MPGAFYIIKSESAMTFVQHGCYLQSVARYTKKLIGVPIKNDTEETNVNSYTCC